MNRKIISIGLIILFVNVAHPHVSFAEQAYGCFVGQDATGGQAVLRLAAERYGDYYEVYGTIASAAIGQMRVKADGWSGAGRMFYRHEYENGAMYIKIVNYTGTSFTLEVEGYGSFPFQRTNC